MSDEPTFPLDAVPGRVTPLAAPPATPPAADKAEQAAWPRWQTAGVALGIGSAAIAAALLYANRGRKP